MCYGILFFYYFCLCSNVRFERWEGDTNVLSIREKNRKVKVSKYLQHFKWIKIIYYYIFSESFQSSTAYKIFIVSFAYATWCPFVRISFSIYIIFFFLYRKGNQFYLRLKFGANDFFIVFLLHFALFFPLVRYFTFQSFPFFLLSLYTNWHSDVGCFLFNILKCVVSWTTDFFFLFYLIHLHITTYIPIQHTERCIIWAFCLKIIYIKKEKKRKTYA